jgi:hypothetical protein
VGEKDFQTTVLEQLQAMQGRMAVVETDVKYLVRNIEKSQDVIAQHSERITAVEQSAKSAHHRITGICATAGAFGAAAGAVANFVASIWPRGGN